DCAICCTWVPTYTSQRSGLTSAVQFIGSMVACATSGSSYTAENVFAAFLRASAALPLLRAAATSSLLSAEAPGLVAALSSRDHIAALSRLTLGPASHVIRKASRALRACQKWSATTTTPLAVGTTLRTPFIVCAAVASTDAALPPNEGL